MINENTEEGAKSAVEYLLAVHDYTYTARDAEIWNSLSGEDCSFCNNVSDTVEQLLENELFILGGSVKIDEILQIDELEPNYWEVQCRVSQKATVITSLTGEVIVEEPAETLDSSFFVEFSASKWILIDHAV